MGINNNKNLNKQKAEINEINSSNKSFTNISLIKSIYITKKVLSYLDQKKKLNIIKYNNKLKTLLNYDIDQYKTLSQKYIEYFKDGMAKEYLTESNTLIYEGEYLKGKRNGKGKEYYKNGEIKFIGKYLNGKKWTGKIYNNEGKKEFEIKNGKGKGKEYSYNGEIIFHCEYLNGEKNGNCQEYDTFLFEYSFDNLIFEGEYMNNKRWGKGKEYHGINNVIFEGNFINGEKKGEGKEYYIEGKIKNK